MLRECCFVWNHALALQRRYYKLFGKYISVGKMKKHFTKRIKRNLLHSQTTQEILERLDESYNRFFKRKSKRPPKFKSPEKFNSFVFKQGGLHKMKILKGGKKKNNQAPFEVFGFRLFDKVLYNNKICFVYGRRKSGSFNIRDFNGENSKDVSRKKFKLIRGKRHPIILK